ncbi:hypothetical protein ABPG75_000382, partial [Micractinium tetrahymenae]
MAALARADAALAALVRARALATLQPSPLAFIETVGVPSDEAYGAAFDARQAGEAAGAAQQASLAMKLAKLARWIAALDTALRPEAAATSGAARGHLEAAAAVIRTGAILAGLLRLPVDTVQQLGRGCTMLVSSGGALLAATAAQPGVRRMIRDLDLLHRSASHVALSLMEMLQDFDIVTRSPAYAAARRAFAAGAAAPGRLLPFLASCTDLLLAAGDDPK